MKNIKTRLDFINENDHSIDDPYDEENWNEGKLDFRYINEDEDLFEWMEDIGIKKNDIDSFKFIFRMSKNIMKRSKKVAMNWYWDHIMIISEELKNKYNFDEENEEYSSFLGILALKGSSIEKN